MRTVLKALIPAPARRWLRAGDRVLRLEAELAATRSLLDRAVADLRAESAALRREIEGRAGEAGPDRPAVLGDRATGILDRLAALEQLTQRLTTRSRQHRHIDVVAFGEVKLFMYTDDAGYKVIPDNIRNQPCAPVDLGDVPPAGDNLTVALLAHHWDNGLDPWVLDVGANYGFESVYTAQLLRSTGRVGRVVAFEPGVVSALLPHTIALNNVTDYVRVESIAVGNYTGPGLMSGEDGHSENNRIVNHRDPDGWACSRIVQVDTLDAYTERHGITADLIVKIDTQGAEPEVLDGMDRLLRDRMTTLVVEFSPREIRRRNTAEDFLARLARHGTILDLNQQGLLTPTTDGLPVVSERNFSGFATDVIARPYEWSDLLVIPYNLPNRDALLTRLMRRVGSQSAAA